MFEFYVGDAMENNYNSLLNELYIFYNRIKNYILLYFEEKIEKSSLEIDFYKDFIISNDFTNGFVKYDNEKNKFLLSIPNGLTKYNSIKSTKPLKLISVEDKMQSQYYSSFTIDELSQIINFYNIDFIKYIKSEFLHEYIRKILNLQGNNIIHYSDEYIDCSEKYGFAINDIIIELETRIFARKFNLLYIPISIGNDDILRTTYLICIEKTKIIFNGNIDELFSNLSRFKYKKILQFEEKEFEKKYNLKINSLNDEKNNYISSKPLNPKKELINLLKTTKNRYLKIKNVVSNSYGFVTITTFIFGVFITFVVAFLVLYLLFRR